jgi:hypothetical protein
VHGAARDKIGGWERRARRRMRRGSYRFARVEAKAFDVWRKIELGLSRRAREVPESWETGDGSHRLLAQKES